MWQLLRVDYLGTTCPRVLYRRVNAKKLAIAFAPPPLPSPPLPSPPLLSDRRSPCCKSQRWQSKIILSTCPLKHHRYDQGPKKCSPFVPCRVVLTVIINFSMDSSTGKLYRPGDVSFRLRFFLCPGLEPILRVLVPSSTPAVRLLSFSSSPSLLREMV